MPVYRSTCSVGVTLTVITEAVMSDFGGFPSCSDGSSQTVVLYISVWRQSGMCCTHGLLHVLLKPKNEEEK